MIEKIYSRPLRNRFLRDEAEMIVHDLHYKKTKYS